MKVQILVDYDNLIMSLSQTRLVDVANLILRKLPALNAHEPGLCEMRLYGGWYEMDSMTKKAQELSASIQNDFPIIANIRYEYQGEVKMKINASLALALNEDPSHHMFNTFRKKSASNNIRIKSQKEAGCSQNDCELLKIRKFMKSKKCPAASCSVASDDLIYRNEQKLVDTMLTCDLLHAEKQGWDCIVLVSDDDDFIPPLRTLLLRGASVFRAHPKYSLQRKKIIAHGNRQLDEIELHEIES